MHMHMTADVKGMESMCMRVQCSQRPWDRIGFPEAGVMGLCEPFGCGCQARESPTRATTSLKHNFPASSLVSNFEQRNDL